MNKQNLINLIMRLKPLEELWLKDLLPDEQEYLFELVKNQTGKNGWIIEYNHSFYEGVKPTKIRKLLFDNNLFTKIKEL